MRGSGGRRPVTLRWAAAGGLLVLLFAALASDGAGADAAAQSQLARGQALYVQYCFACHLPGSVGPELTREVLAGMGTARTLFNFIRTAMPQNAPGSLTDQEYWDILAHMLAETGLLPAGIRPGPETADTIRLAP